MMKLSLMPQSDSNAKEKFYVVGQLSKGNMVYGAGGAQWKHLSRFYLVDADKLQPSAEAGFELSSDPLGEGKIDGRQLLHWSCAQPDTETSEPSPHAVEEKALA